MLKSEANPKGLAIDAFGTIRGGVAADRSQFRHDLDEASTTSIARAVRSPTECHESGHRGMQGCPRLRPP
jgi:hypothetical protein